MKKIGQELHIGLRGKEIAIELDAIVRLQSVSNYTMIFTAARKFITTGTLKKALSVINERKFIQVHRSHAVNKDKISFILDENIFLINDVSVPVSRRRKREIMEKYRL